MGMWLPLFRHQQIPATSSPSCACHLLFGGKAPTDNAVLEAPDPEAIRGEVPMLTVEGDDCEGGNEGSGDEFDDDLVNTQSGDRGCKTFEEAMNDHISNILQFVEGLRYQVQFRDEEMLQALEREGGSFLRFARACTSKERKKTAGRTWDKSVGVVLELWLRSDGLLPTRGWVL